jgi:hypothetical protein
MTRFHKQMIGGLIATGLVLLGLTSGLFEQIAPILILVAFPPSMLVVSKKMLERAQLDPADCVENQDLAVLRAGINKLKAHERLLAAQIAEIQSRFQTANAWQTTPPVSTSGGRR